MAHCKHWNNGICKDCKKNCPIKAKLARKAAKAARPKNTTLATDMEFTVAPPSLVEALAHGEQVARLAAKIFASMSAVYTIPAPWGDVLQAAARLHDIGWVYGQKSHHKVSARMIRGGNVEEVEKSIRPLAALVARYHRQTEPSRQQRRFAELSSLERRGVRRMAALLRLADALDYSHAGLVQDVEVLVQENAIVLILDCASDCTAEVERLITKKQLFKKVFKKDVLCQCKTQENPMADCPTQANNTLPLTILEPLTTATETTKTAPKSAPKKPKTTTPATPKAPTQKAAPKAKAEQPPAVETIVETAAEIAAKMDSPMGIVAGIVAETGAETVTEK